jgi:hypothetical protein
VTANAPKRHHYVPQFYLRQFACADDRNKVNVMEEHGDRLVADRKSIRRIGYENALHDCISDGEADSIEEAINRRIETPFAASGAWTKILSHQCELLNAGDGPPIYGFARHLQRRNLEALRFIEEENARFRAGSLDLDLTAEERAMHQWIAASSDNAHALFRNGALDTALPEDAGQINVMVCRSPIPLRTSTNPAVRISHPGRSSVFGSFFDTLRTWWLSLGPHCGAFIVAGGPPALATA